MTDYHEICHLDLRGAGGRVLDYMDEFTTYYAAYVGELPKRVIITERHAEWLQASMNGHHSRNRDHRPERMTVKDWRGQAPNVLTDCRYRGCQITTPAEVRKRMRIAEMSTAA